ncbi:MAG: alpha/beta fold hydrolase [Candidatus Thorarchaeota archaeon]
MENLESFQQQHKTNEVIINNVKWVYYDLGDAESEFAVVFLHGTTGSEEIFWIQIQSLLVSYRIVSFNLPPIIGVNDLSRGIHEILYRLNIKKIVMVGTSFGGYLAQSFSFKYKEMVHKLVLSNTFITTQLYNQKYKKLLMIEKIIPTFLLKRIMKKSLLSIKHIPTQEYLLFQLEHYLSKKTLIARLKSFITNEVLKEAPIDHILIIETLDDPLVPKQLQDELKRAYPEASVKIFEKEANHFPYLTKSDEYTQILMKFIQS